MIVSGSLNINEQILQVASSRLHIGHDGAVCFELDGHCQWRSTGPFVLLHYYDRQHPRAQVVAAPSGDGHTFGTAGTPSLSARGELAFEKISGRELGVVASFENAGITIQFRISLNEDGLGFSVTIDDSGVTEKMPWLYRVLSIEILPEFGAAKTGESGYLTLPNWMGCQTFFDKTYPREVRQTIYTSNDQWEHHCHMPVFGITRSQGTLCGLVAQGDMDAQLVCRVHWEQQQANSVHPQLFYRWQQQDELLPGNRQVRYAFVPADYNGGEGYVFCGKIYRQFLMQERGLQTWDQKKVTRPAAGDYMERFFLKIFMAYKDPQPDGRGPYHAACTFNEARQILEQCLNRGMKKISAVLVGWGHDGHDGACPTRFPVDERLGGEKELKQLLAWCREHDVLLAMHDSYGEVYRLSDEFDEDDLMRHRTGEYWEGIIWSGGQACRSCPSVFLEKHVKRDIPRTRALGLYGHHHIDAVGSFMTCYSEKHPVQKRQEYVGYIRLMFEYISQQMGSVSTEMPFGPYFDVVDGFFHSYSRPSKWHLASPIGMYFYDRIVPLLTVALHGCVNCLESIKTYQDHPLSWLAMGMAPQYEVCYRRSDNFGIPAYNDVAQTMADMYDLYYGNEGYHLRLSRLMIQGHWEIRDGVTRTLYSDGTEVDVDLNSGSASLSSPDACVCSDPQMTHNTLTGNDAK